MNEHDLEGAITEIWTTICEVVLSQQARPSKPPSAPPSGSRILVGCVQITGAWKGAVILRCIPKFAAVAAATMFATGDTTSVEEQRDALGELTNMIAGNLKAMLPAPTSITAPTVSDGVDGVVEVLGTRLVSDVHFEVGDHHVSIAVRIPKDPT